MDERGRRIAIVAHCILNQNSKVEDTASERGLTKKVVDLLYKYGFGVIQLPCPEFEYLGLRRFWFSKEQYDNVGFRNYCRRIARKTVELIENYVKEGYKVPLVIGISGSPSCGVEKTSSSKWRGNPMNIEGKIEIVEGSGVLMEEIRKEVSENNLKVRFVDYSDMEEEKSLAKIEDLIKRSIRR